MRGSVGVGRLLMAGMLVWAAAGCSSVVEGAAEPASGQEGLFDPCKDIPDSVLEEVGLDPATEEVDIEGIEQPGWKICSWTESWYYVVLFSNRFTIDEVKENPDYTGFQEIALDARSGVRYHRVSDDEIGKCYVAVEAKQGSIWIVVEKKGSAEMQGATCDLATSYATALEGYVPR
ncbi:DUF3558 domain-containing protein [Rhodococcus sp. H-CA8f]|uniref:DUF3558 domain-containing protein n=1 Tax=Rhodococcus sp. H-CA8f TaxID=1727214 RepID=UPI001E539176|nr:DUF3558 domain-containing protein [Rhodococcus sp. H-CA8f]